MDSSTAPLGTQALGTCTARRTAALRRAPTAGDSSCCGQLSSALSPAVIAARVRRSARRCTGRERCPVVRVRPAAARRPAIDTLSTHLLSVACRLYRPTAHKVRQHQPHTCSTKQTHPPSARTARLQVRERASPSQRWLNKDAIRGGQPIQCPWRRVEPIVNEWRRRQQPSCAACGRRSTRRTPPRRR